MPHLPIDQFLEYVKAFNRRDYEKQHSYYTSDIELILPDASLAALKGSAAIMEHYKNLHAQAEEVVVPMVAMSERHRVFYMMDAYLKYHEEVERGFKGYHVYAGDVIKMEIWAVYDVRADGKIKKITCNLYRCELLGQVEMQERVCHSKARSDLGLCI